jgi:hypothetical protein
MSNLSRLMKKLMPKCLALPVALLVLDVAVVGCSSSGPCHGAECASNSMGSGHFAPGPFASSATALDGARCYSGGVSIRLFLNQPFTEPPPQTPVQRADALRVYWSVCNAGLADASAQPASYAFTPHRKVSPTETVDLPTTSFGIPALAHCTCDVQSRSFQDELDPGSYTFALTGVVEGSVDRNINP